jgi:hypothetical protein
MWQRIDSWKLGDRILFNNVNIQTGEIPTTTPLVNWYDDGYVCTATYDILKEHEEIIIDGHLDEDAWSYGGWLVGDSASGGVYQDTSTIPDDVNLTYKYKFITDENYLYGSLVNNLLPNNNDNTPSIFRIWIRSNPEATVYTHIIDIRYLTSGPVISLYRNTSLTENKAEIITSPEGDQIAWYVGEDKQRIEFRAKLADLNLDGSFEYFVSFANEIKDDQYTLFA